MVQKNVKAKANRLVNETSPYLLQHAYNPVDWHPWSKEALQLAKDQGKPILLSIGYSACHWCHVMEHESFEDESIAHFMNENYINIKVDREERPDLDDIYMKSVQMLTGHGGWPMTVFLTPELRPFFGGTYFPPEPRHGMPSFPQILYALSQAWKDRRTEIEESSLNISRYLHDIYDGPVEPGEISRDAIDTALHRLVNVFDHQWGGFGGAPKFPQGQSVELALRTVSHGAKSFRAQCEEVVETSLNRMAYGGIFDQLGGGFARYSVDRQWLIPHFEKMLYDNAQLVSLYARAYLYTNNSFWLDIVSSTADFVLRDLGAGNGGIYSSLDADSEGEEGKFYVFRPSEITEILGAVESIFFCKIYGITEAGNFEHGSSVLHLASSPANLAKENNLSVEELFAKLAPMKEKVLEERAKRIAPHRDEKILTGWNALMISGFVDAYKASTNDKYKQAAIDCALFILNNLCVDGKLLRTWGKGKAKLNAYFEDYAYFIAALLDLASIDSNPLWLTSAFHFNGVVLNHFRDKERGDFFSVSDDYEDLIVRPKNNVDSAIPSAVSVQVFNLMRLSRIFNKPEWFDIAKHVISLQLKGMEKHPDGFANMLCALDFCLAEPKEIVLVGSKTDQAFKEMLCAINSKYLPNTVILAWDEANTSLEISVPNIGKVQLPQIALLENRLGLNEAKAYICSNYTCQNPVSTLKDLAELI